MPAENFEQWFEELSRLAQEDPEAFEARRRALIEETISQAPEERQDRLRRFQWRIDKAGQDPSWGLHQAERHAHGDGLR